MKTYILKDTVYNDIHFPQGTIVKLITDPHYTFEVVEGELTGKKGDIVTQLNGWLLEDTPQNRANLSHYQTKRSEIYSQLDILNKEWKLLSTAKFK